jgi:hypothetical protein
MTITTYTELKATISDFLNRDDLTASVPSFIALGEADMQRKIRHWRQEKRSTAEINTQYSALPSDFIEAIRFYNTDTDTQPLELISQWELLDRKRKASNVSGSPTYYAITAGEIEVYPVPDGTYNMELYYFGRVAPLSDSVAANWILTYHPDVYLYGALMHTAMYLKDDARLQGWAALYQQGIDAINRDGETAKFGGSGRRMKIRSY